MKSLLKFQNQFLTTVVVFALFTLFTSNAKGQNSFTLPEGYQTYKDYQGKESRADGDFDGDGVNDLAIVCADKNGTKIIVVYLASKWLVNQSYWWFPWDYDSELNYTNNVLTIKAVDQFFTTTLKLKYSSSLSNMKLIGYASETFERAGNIGEPTYMVKSSSKSINLNTGEYQVNGGVKKKINIDTITLSSIEKYFEYLSQVGDN